MCLAIVLSDGVSGQGTLLTDAFLFLTIFCSYSLFLNKIISAAMFIIHQLYMSNIISTH